MKKPLLILLLFTGLSQYGQSSLLRTGSTSSSSYQETRYYNPAEELLYWIISEITYGILIESFLEKDTPMHDASLTPYPYFSENEGNYTYDGESVPFRVEAVSTLMFDNRQHLTGSFSAKLRFAKRLDIRAGYIHLLPDKHTLEVSQTDFVLDYHRIRTRRLDFWYGLGVVFSKYTEDNTGLVLNLGSELFLGRKLSAEALIKWDFYEQGTHRHTNFQLNYFLGHWRLHAGIHNYKYLFSRSSALQLGLKYYF